MKKNGLTGLKNRNNEQQTEPILRSNCRYQEKARFKYQDFITSQLVQQKFSQPTFSLVQLYDFF